MRVRGSSVILSFWFVVDCTCSFHRVVGYSALVVPSYRIPPSCSRSRSRSRSCSARFVTTRTSKKPCPVSVSTRSNDDDGALSWSLRATRRNGNGNGNGNRNSNSSNGSVNRKEKQSGSKVWTPLWTVLAAALGGCRVGSAPSASAMNAALSMLMLSVGLSVQPSELWNILAGSGRGSGSGSDCSEESEESKSHGSHHRVVLLTNVVCCFVLCPLVTQGVVSMMMSSSRSRSRSQFSSSARIGTVLLSVVGGGQASNLFTQLAGGDVALSVACTLSTTVLAVVAAPALAQWMLCDACAGSSVTVTVDAMGMLRSVLQWVLVPLSVGTVLSGLKSSYLSSSSYSLSQSSTKPKASFSVKMVSSLLESVGILSTLFLVYGGSHTASQQLSFTTQWPGRWWWEIMVGSVGMPLLWGVLAWGVAHFLQFPLPQTKAFVIEVFSKSPTLAHVLAVQHFDNAASMVPAAAMVTLAVLGSLVAGLWSKVTSDTTISKP